MKTRSPPKPSPLRGRPKDQQKREGIIRAASALFFTDGYELTSMEAVARKADVSKLTIYSHFANKDELFKAIVNRRCDEKAMPLSFQATADKAPAVALTQIGNHLLDLLFSPESLHLSRIMQAEAAHHPKVVQIYYEGGPQRVRKAFGELLSTWNKRGVLKIPDVSIATEQFFSLLKGERMMKTCMMLVEPPTKNEIRKHVRATVEFFLAAYGQKSSRGKK